MTHLEPSMVPIDNSLLAYHLIPKNGGTSHKIDLYDTSFNMWEKTWFDESKALGSSNHWNADQFLRQDIVAVLTYQAIPVGVHLYSFFDLRYDVSLLHSYFKICPSEFVEDVKSRGKHLLMSMEALAVDPAFQGNRSDLSIGRMLVQLGIQVFLKSSADVVVGIARRDKKVNKMAYDLGFECGLEDVLANGIRCDCVALYKPYTVDKLLDALAERLWNNMTDYGCFS